MAAESEKKAPLLTPTLKLFMVAMVLANISGGMHGALLPLYIEELGATIAQIGMVFTVASIVPLLLQILGGWISDSIGRLRTIAIGSVGGLIGYTGLWLAPTWQWAMVAMGVAMTAFPLVGPSFQSFIADESNEENRGRVFGITTTIFMIIGVVGPPLGGYLSQNYGFKTMFAVAVSLYGLAVILRFWMAGRARRTTEAEAKPLTFQSLRTDLKVIAGLLSAGGLVTWIFISDGISDIAFRLTGSLTPLYQEGIGGLTVFQIGILGTIQAVTMMICNTPSGWLSDKYGERVGISAGFILFTAAFLVFLPAETFWGYAAAWILFGIGASLLNPAYNSLVSKAVPEDKRGLAYGFFSTSVGLISLPAPWIGAHLWEKFSPQTPFLVTAAASIAIGIIAWFKLRLPVETKTQVEPITKAGLPAE